MNYFALNLKTDLNASYNVCGYGKGSKIRFENTVIKNCKKREWTNQTVKKLRKVFSKINFKLLNTYFNESFVEIFGGGFVVDGEITIKCKRSGIHGTDGILVAGGRLSISSEKYGLRTVKSGADGRGNLVVSGGEHRIIAGRHAFLVSRGDLYVYNCEVSDNSIVSTASVGGRTRIQSGCFE